jgi:ketosteroid isomerase-like protein
MRTKLVSLCVLSFLLMGCATTGPEKVSSELVQKRKAVLQASQRWDQFFNAADADTLAGLYATGAVSMPPNAPAIAGRAALQKDFETFFTNNLARHETLVEDLIIDGGLAVERARYRMTMKPRAGGPEVVETGKHVEVRRYEGGRWLIVAEIWNADAPPPVK